jgi:dienelactone hydrolase
VVPLVLVVAYAVGVPVGIAVFATNVGRPPLPAATPADHGLEHLDVALVTEDGVRLDGWYVPSRTGAAVAVLHGASSTRAAVLDQAVVLARHGYGVLLFDARGMGTSGGRAMNLGWAGDADVHAAVDFLAARPDVDPDRIAVLGESMGGEEAIGAMASDPRIRAVVAEGATHRAADDWTWLPDRYGWRGRVQLGVHRLTTALTDVLTDERPPTALRAAVAAAGRPVLLITAGEVADEAAAAEHIRTGAPERVQVWTVPGAAHTGGLATAPGEWQRQVTAFLDASLDPPAG